MATETQIIKSPDVLGGKARLKNRRIGVVDIVEYLQRGDSVTEIADRLEIDSGDVEAARDYWQNHPDEIAAQLQNRAELYTELVHNGRAPES